MQPPLTEEARPLPLSLTLSLPPIEPEPRRRPRPSTQSLALSLCPLLSVQIKQNRLTNERGEDNAAAAAGRECSVGLGDGEELLHDVDGHLFQTYQPLANIVPNKLRTLENRTKVTQV